MMKLPRLLLPSLVLAVAGCGSVDEPGNPDAGTSSGELRIISSSPGDGERGVRPLAEVEVVLSGAIDPATLTAGAVTLTLETTLGLVGQVIEETAVTTVSWDAATLTLHVVPIDAMDPEARYRLAIAGLADAAGHQLDATLRFETRWTRVARAVTYDTDGVVRSYDTTEPPDADDPYLERTAIFDDPGPDATWLTADDDLGGWTDRTRVSATEYRERGYNGPGDDAVWRTADDHVWYLYRYELDAGGRMTRRITAEDAGADGTPFTADDPVSASYQLERDAAGRVVGSINFTAPGPDGVWFTADDGADGRYARSFDEAGHINRSRNYDSPGPDALWNTADDVVSDVIGYRYDDRGVLERMVWADAPGPDGNWFTTDDAFYAGTLQVRDDDDNRVGATSFNAPGLDATWHTSDDVVSSYDVFEPLARDLYRTMTRHSGAGPDGVWFTADDPASLHYEQRYADDGVRTHTLIVGGAGPDGVWFTADDQIVRDTEFDQSL